MPLFGVSFVNVTCVMVKIRLLEVPPPGVRLVTKKFRVPVAPAVMLRFAVNEVGSFTRAELTVMPAPALTVAPSIKFVPEKTTSNVCPAAPAGGAKVVNMGTGLLTLKIWLFEISLPLLMEKLRAPVAAAAVISMLAVRLVALVTFTDRILIPNPTFGMLTPLRKFVPVKTISNICKRLPLAGAMLVSIGVG